MKYVWRFLAIFIALIVALILIRFLSFQDTLTRVFSTIYLLVWIPFSILLIKQSYEK